MRYKLDKLEQHIENVITFKKGAGQPAPETLTIPSPEDRVLLARLAVEECLELCTAMGINISDTDGNYLKTASDVFFHKTDEVNPVEVMDACVDNQWVGVTGPAVAFGLSSKLTDCLKAVDDNNLSKLVDGYRHPETGKFCKGPSYVPVDLSTIIYEINS
jgi:predicted HAD superfamily Cof-like phosphohydrolase